MSAPARPGRAALAAGLNALRREEFADAIAHLEAAEREASADPAAPAYLSGAFLALGRPDEAAAAVERALALEPDGFAPRLKAGELALRLGDLGRAEADFLAAVRSAAPGSPELAVARQWLAISRQRLRRSISRGALLPDLRGLGRRLLGAVAPLLGRGQRAGGTSEAAAAAPPD
jgi:tetratricopeptide (TPR) repeat protein